MKPYGIKSQDCGCCPGHDSHPTSTYRNRRSIKARARGKMDAHSRARATKRLEIHKIFKELGNN